MSMPLNSIFVLLFGIASVLVLSGSDQLALFGVGALAAVPLVAIALLCFAAALNGNTRCIQGIGVAAVILISTTVRFREYEDKSIDFQVLLKLGAIALMFLTAVIAYLFHKLRFRWTAANAWLLLSLYFVFTSIYSDTLVFSAVTSISLLACGLFCLYLVQSLGTQRAVGVIILSSAIICLLSIIVFIVFPKLGKMQGWTGTEFGSLNRMRGVTPSANAIGSIAALGLLFAYFYGQQMRGLMWCVAVALFPLALICLVLSNNRMSMAGIVLAVICASLFRGQTLLKGGLFATVGVVGLCIFLAFPDEILASLSRSGDAAEITSGTGRSSIWAVVIEHIMARPVLGYGYTSSISVLPKDPRLFGVAAHAHNLYLEVMFSGGIVALVLLIAAIAVTVKSAIRAHASREAALLLFFLARGIMEASPFSGIVGFNAFAFFITMTIIAAKNSQVLTHSYEPRGTLQPKLSHSWIS